MWETERIREIKERLMSKTYEEIAASITKSITKFCTATCPTCQTHMNVPKEYYMPNCTAGEWACPRCGQVCESRTYGVNWTDSKIQLAIPAGGFRGQRLLNAHMLLDELLKRYPDIGILFISGSRTGVSDDNDLAIGEIFLSRAQAISGEDYWETHVWSSVEEDMVTLLIALGEQTKEIEEAIGKKIAENGNMRKEEV